MKRSLARKIIESHLVSGRWEIGAEIGIKIDLTPREAGLILAGGALNFIREARAAS